MKFSAWPRTVFPWAEVLAEVKHAEATGWDGIWVADHFMPNTADKEGLTQECLTVLAAIGASVPRVRLGSLVVGNTYRNPAVLAKQAAQVDGSAAAASSSAWAPAGRRTSTTPTTSPSTPWAAPRPPRGVGAGPAQPLRQRPHQLRRPLLPDQGRAARAEAGAGKLPLLIGGGGEKSTMRIAAQYADEWNTWGRPSTLARKGEVLDQHLADLERDPKTIKRSCQALILITEDQGEIDRASGGMPTLAGSIEFLRDAMGQYKEAKIDEFILPNFNMGDDAGKRLETYDRFMEDVASKFRD